MNKVEFVVYYYKFPPAAANFLQSEKALRPIGLLLWDKNKDNLLEHLYVGLIDQLARPFPTLQLFSPYSELELKVLARRGYIQSALREKGFIDLALPTCDITQRINIHTKFPITEFAIWGVQQVG